MLAYSACMALEVDPVQPTTPFKYLSIGADGYLKVHREEVARLDFYPTTTFYRVGERLRWEKTDLEKAQDELEKANRAMAQARTLLLRVAEHGEHGGPIIADIQHFLSQSL